MSKCSALFAGKIVKYQLMRPVGQFTKFLIEFAGFSTWLGRLLSTRLQLMSWPKILNSRLLKKNELIES